MNIYERLEKDHDKQRDLCARLDNAETAERRFELWSALKIELEAHALAEEQVFYSKMMRKPDGTEHARHSVHEHQQMTEMIEELDVIDINSDIWAKKFSKLKDRVIHHVDEEEADIFPVAKEVISNEAAEDMVDKFDDRKAASTA